VDWAERVDIELFAYVNLGGQKMRGLVELLLKNDCFKMEDGDIKPDIAVALKKIDSDIYERSARKNGGEIFLLKRVRRGRRLLVFSADGGEPGKGFAGEISQEDIEGNTVKIKVCGATEDNAKRLREVFPFTKPRPLGLKTSFGMGDRMGIATPGHVRATRGFNIFPIYAQQSIREMERTGRTPENVMDDACWAVFQEGWTRSFGADADHLKTEKDVRDTAAAGFTFFTIDPSDHLNFAADSLSGSELGAAFDALFSDSEIKSFLIERYSEPFMLRDPESGATEQFKYDSDELRRIAVKFLPAVRHTVRMYRLLLEIFIDADRFDFEMSVDETPAPTTPKEHLFVAVELKRAGVPVQSLAPRYTGEFQKGIDFIGDRDEFKQGLESHALIARCMGPYKLSIHSGSDKFSIFPIVGKTTRGLYHEKTAGTSYLAAIRVVARRNPSLYREIHEFALERFETDRASYHVTTKLDMIPNVNNIADDHLEYLFDSIDARQLIHITYGSVLTYRNEEGSLVFYDRIMDTLDEYEEEHYSELEAHFRRHMESLGAGRLNSK